MEIPSEFYKEDEREGMPDDADESPSANDDLPSTATFAFGAPPVEALVNDDILAATLALERPHRGERVNGACLCGADTLRERPTARRVLCWQTVASF